MNKERDNLEEPSPSEVANPSKLKNKSEGKSAEIKYNKKVSEKPQKK